MSIEAELLIKSDKATIEDLEQLHQLGYIFPCEDGKVAAVEYKGTKA